MFAAIRAATVLVLMTDIGELLSVVIVHDEIGGLFLDGPRRREAAVSKSGINLASWR